MKKFIKNYLAKLQENDKKGFSLVELIIVMAIMAILVGIVASQVLPYMDKSRQSKDQQVLSSICTDLVSATAQSGVKLAGVTDKSATASDWSSYGTGWDKVDDVYKELQGGSIASFTELGFKSKVGSAAGDVRFDYDEDTGVIKVYFQGKGSEDPDSSKYIVTSSSKSSSTSDSGSTGGDATE